MQSSAMLADVDRGLALDLTARLVEAGRGRIRTVILYGSRVRGEASAESDFDLLVVEVDPVSKREEMRRLREAVNGLPHTADVWVMGETEFEETRGVIGGLAYPANKYGIVLYENT